MTHPNFQTNGASLEDCHTNFFALTELSGIKWRKLVYCDLGGNGGHHQGHYGGGGGVGGGGGGGSGGNNSGLSEPLDDPVLRSYARCLAADILCVWRRVSTPRPTDMFEPGPPPPPPLSLATSKELWIFWYGEEPDLNVLISPELSAPESAQGSWEKGLSYECRSLLFKALHNLIERCLLSRDFIRLGKWFIQPYDGPKRNDSTTMTHLSFSFAFFVHGESSVCASVDVRQHPPVRRLNRFHLQQAQTSTNGLKVILAPFGLAGNLTGQSYKPSESTARFLEDWNQFYPLEKGNTTLNESSVVEVIVGDVKMKYPSCYVFVTDMDDLVNNGPLLHGNGMNATTHSSSSLVKNGSTSPVLVQTPPPSPVQIQSRVPQPGPYSVSIEHPFTMSKDETAANVLPERAWHECIHGGPPNGANSGQSQQQHEFTGQWDFVDPYKRANCTCSKCRKYVNSMQLMSSGKWAPIGGAGGSCVSSGSGSGSSGGGGSGGTPSRPPKTARGGRVPFHRRHCATGAVTTPHTSAHTAHAQTVSTDRCSGNSSNNGNSTSNNSGSYTPQGGPPSYPRTQESQAVPSVGSPPSVAPSPLPNPHSQQPASVPAADQTMPMLSPHPPSSASNLHLQSPSMMDHKMTAMSTTANSAAGGTRTGHHADEPKSEESATSPTSAASGINSTAMTTGHHDVKTLTEQQQLQQQQNQANVSGGTAASLLLKRPILSVKEYETSVGDEEQTLEMLYDYSTLDAWLNHPVKKFKPDAKEQLRNSLATSRSNKTDIYSMYNHNGITNNNNNNPTSGSGMSNVASNDLNQNMKNNQMFKQEFVANDASGGGGGGAAIAGSECEQSNVAVSMHHGIKRPGDPYEFDEDGTNAGCTIDGFKRGQVVVAGGVVVKEEPKDSKKNITGNLFTSEGLQPSYKDLDQIFDNSDDTSSDEAIQVQTPPGSTTLSHHDDTKRLSGGHGGCPGILRPEELSKMFPTPPSLEHNPIASPCGQLDLTPLQDYPDVVTTTNTTTTSGSTSAVRIKQEIYPNMGSPQEENIDDWSYVYKPPIVSKMVGSSKYAPLTNLPSQSQPSVVLPPQCVYKPSWVQHAEKMMPNQQGQTTAPSSNQQQPQQQQQPSIPSTMHHQFPPSPLHTGGAPGGSFRQPPPPYELPSPATSTASSYLNKNVNSVEPAALTPTAAILQRTPEASALALNILLTDTVSNIFRDHNFDSCTLCVCNAGSRVVGNIRGADAGVYLLSAGNSNSSCDRTTHFGAAALHLQQQQQPVSPYMGGQVAPPPPYVGGMLTPPPTLLQQQHSQHQQQQHNQQMMMQQQDEDGFRCSCGFSAVVNRKLAHGSGLFYEDEMEITGIAEDPGEKKKSSLLSYLMSTGTIKLEPSATSSSGSDQPVDILPHNLIELIREQCVIIPSTANALYRSARYLRTNNSNNNNTTNPSTGGSNSTKQQLFTNTVHLLEYTDSNDITTIAIEQTRHQCSAYDASPSQPTSQYLCKMMDVEMSKKGSGSGGATYSSAFAVHRWPFLRASGPQCNQEIVRVMRTLQPLLQEAIQKKCQTGLWEAPSAVKGPLTWRQFHRLAGRGTEDRCEPQPIPSLVVGHDKDWLSLSPYAIQHWESLLLEPYSFPRDIAYIVVAPDNEAILPRVRTFFKELSTVYEMCKLGRHSPITKVLRDGILRVGKTAKTKIGNEPVEDWFTWLGDGDLSDMLKLYAQVCKHHLAPHLQQVPMDKTLLDPPQHQGGGGDKPMASPMPPPPSNTPDGMMGGGGQQDKAPSTPKSEQDGDGMRDSGGQTSLSNDNLYDDDEREAPSVVVYLVEPFSLGSDEPDLQRLACLALLRCFQSVLAAVPENIRNNISVQIISLESIVELGKARDRNRHSDHMRALSLSIFSQCRRLLVHTNNVKSLTGFGTAAMADLFLKSKDEKNRAAYKLYTPPYILAPMREKVEAVESFGKGTADQASVLYLSYCLSDDQSWLIAVATDERGELFETVTINIDIPNRSRRKKASARRIGLEKLMDFVLGVMSQSVRPWRLVVGRLGRIGHGELKGWSWLLSKKNLLKASKHLKEICNQCSLMYPSAVPCILSACLVSLEPDSVLRLMPDQFTPDERFSQASVNSQLSTPTDVSCTHILVFPTSATTQSSVSTFIEEQHTTPEWGDDEMFIDMDEGIDGIEGIEGVNDFSDIFNWPDNGAGGVQSPGNSPGRREESGPDSPTGGVNNGRQGSPFQCGNVGSKSNAEIVEEVGTLLQQPLALGYFVSTAPTGRMPKWFWSACPHLEGVCPAFLKNALHLHNPNIQQNSDDLFQHSATSVTSHPLDSQLTTDVLRYVLEGYNALSWLTLDSNTRDRLSCLPVHMQVLVQLYHTTAALL